ncbi:T9SS type A sorting domain-containing protein [Thalassobellus sediminis]|uniref:T9SS type A sorting domain-containing protein n=1 Tax=Thalassobellus sediminis TaxID=3367753 RepID=UPI00378D253D
MKLQLRSQKIEENKNNIIIFPNPFCNQVNIQRITSPSIVSIMNIFGQEIHKEKTLNSQLEINVTNYQKGHKELIMTPVFTIY